jgi:hypothetical protein
LPRRSRSFCTSMGAGAACRSGQIMAVGGGHWSGRALRCWRARSSPSGPAPIGGLDEIHAMRFAARPCLRAGGGGDERFAKSAVPRGGVSEDEVWAVLNAETSGKSVPARCTRWGPA